MNRGIDYSLYNITCSSQFENGLSAMKKEGMTAEVKKLFRIIDEIIAGEDMYTAEYSRMLENSPKVYHIHLDGRVTGDIILLYTVDGRDIDLDLRLYNIVDHKNLSKSSSNKFIHRQQLHSFNVIENKFSQEQLDYVEECYLGLISDYRFHQLRGDKRAEYTKTYIQDYINNCDCSTPLAYDEFLQILNYFENIHKKSIFGSLDLSQDVYSPPITDREQQYILQLIEDYDIDIVDAYVETEVDEYNDVYETMYVKVSSDSYRSIKLMEAELYSLDSLFKIGFDYELNGLGKKFGRTYEFFHYFED